MQYNISNRNTDSITYKCCISKTGNFSGKFQQLGWTIVHSCYLFDQDVLYNRDHHLLFAQQCAGRMNQWQSFLHYGHYPVFCNIRDFSDLLTICGSAIAWNFRSPVCRMASATCTCICIMPLKNLFIYIVNWIIYASFSASFGQSDHFQKQIITLDGRGINCAGPVGEIASICPNVVELDLAKNDLSDFQEVRNEC